MPRVYTMLLKVTRIRLRIIATDCTWSTSVDVEVLIFRKQAQVSVTLVKVLVTVGNYTALRRDSQDATGMTTDVCPRDRTA